MNKINKEEVKADFYIVDSVKGGCGKTSLAIWKAIDLAKSNPEKRVCYIDLDLLGTSIEKMLGLQPRKKEYHYLNKLFAGDRMAVQKKRVKRDFDLFAVTDPDTQAVKYQFFYNTDSNKPAGPENALSIGMVFSSPEQDEKNMFRAGFPTDTHHIDFDFFARRLNELFKELLDGGITDFVIDMPPNSDPYTDSIFGQFLKRKKERNELGVHLLLVSSLDRAHLDANQQWLHNLCNKNNNWYPFISVSYYFNDVRNNYADKAKEEEKRQEAKYMVSAFVKKMVEACHCDIDSYFVVHNKYLSDAAIMQNQDAFPALKIISLNEDKANE